MKKAMPQNTIDLDQLERELEENGYEQEEIDDILQEARSVNIGSFYSADNLYEFLYKMKMIERDY